MSIFIAAGWCILEIPFDDDVPLSTKDAAGEAIGCYMKDTWGQYFKNFITDWKNGQYFIIFNQSRNHPSRSPDIIHEMFEYVTVNAPYSIGVAHMFYTN